MDVGVDYVNEDLPLLISRHLDGELASDEAAQLAARLCDDLAATDRLVVDSFIHAQLQSWMDQQSEICAAFPTDPKSGVNELDESIRWPAPALPPGAQKSSASHETSGHSRRTHQGRFSFAAAAALVAVAASLLLVAYILASRPYYVGQLTDATECQWATAPVKLSVGTFLESGEELELIKGRAVITFQSGARLLVEGPTSLRLDSPREIHMTSGRIAAKVPSQAIGFAVNSSLARIVDLGTAFTFSLDAEKSFRLDVFEGLVELELNERFGAAAEQPARVAEVHAVSFDVDSADIAPVPFLEGQQMPF